jgi:aryl-alcohol dehydrogenase-like predicted oxidoreductase
LIDRTIELEVIPACKAYGLGLIPWSPLKGGVLGGVLKKQADGRRSSDLAQKAIAKHGSALEKYEALCERIAVPPGDVALAWLLANPAVTAPIVGPRTMEQLDAAIRALDAKLDDGVLKELDALFPGPGGAAPEAYAW